MPHPNLSAPRAPSPAPGPPAAAAAASSSSPSMLIHPLAREAAGSHAPAAGHDVPRPGAAVPLEIGSASTAPTPSNGSITPRPSPAPSRAAPHPLSASDGDSVPALPTPVATNTPAPSATTTPPWSAAPIPSSAPLSSSPAAFDAEDSFAQHLRRRCARPAGWCEDHAHPEAAGMVAPGQAPGHSGSGSGSGPGSGSGSGTATGHPGHPHAGRKKSGLLGGFASLGLDSDRDIASLDAKLLARALRRCAAKAPCQQGKDQSSTGSVASSTRAGDSRLVSDALRTKTPDQADTSSLCTSSIEDASTFDASVDEPGLFDDRAPDQRWIMAPRALLDDAGQGAQAILDVLSIDEMAILSIDVGAPQDWSALALAPVGDPLPNAHKCDTLDSWALARHLKQDLVWMIVPLDLINLPSDHRPHATSEFRLPIVVARPALLQSNQAMAGTPYLCPEAGTRSSSSSVGESPMPAAASAALLGNMGGSAESLAPTKPATSAAAKRRKPVRIFARKKCSIAVRAMVATHVVRIVLSNDATIQAQRQVAYGSPSVFRGRFLPDRNLPDADEELGLTSDPFLLEGYNAEKDIGTSATDLTSRTATPPSAKGSGTSSPKEARSRGRARLRLFPVNTHGHTPRHASNPFGRHARPGHSAQEHEGHQAYAHHALQDEEASSSASPRSPKLHGLSLLPHARHAPPFWGTASNPNLPASGRYSSLDGLASRSSSPVTLGTRNASPRHMNRSPGSHSNPRAHSRAPSRAASHTSSRAHSRAASRAPSSHVASRTASPHPQTDARNVSLRPGGFGSGGGPSGGTPGAVVTVAAAAETVQGAWSQLSAALHHHAHGSHSGEGREKELRSTSERESTDKPSGFHALRPWIGLGHHDSSPSGRSAASRTPPQRSSSPPPVASASASGEGHDASQGRRDRSWIARLSLKRPVHLSGHPFKSGPTTATTSEYTDGHDIVHAHTRNVAQPTDPVMPQAARRRVHSASAMSPLDPASSPMEPSQEPNDPGNVGRASTETVKTEPDGRVPRLPRRSDTGSCASRASDSLSPVRPNSGRTLGLSLSLRPSSSLKDQPGHHPGHHLAPVVSAPQADTATGALGDDRLQPSRTILSASPLGLGHGDQANAAGQGQSPTWLRGARIMAHPLASTGKALHIHTHSDKHDVSESSSPSQTPPCKTHSQIAPLRAGVAPANASAHSSAPSSSGNSSSALSSQTSTVAGRASTRFLRQTHSSSTALSKQLHALHWTGLPRKPVRPQGRQHALTVSVPEGSCPRLSSTLVPRTGSTTPSAVEPGSASTSPAPWEDLPLFCPPSRPLTSTETHVSSSLGTAAMSPDTALTSSPSAALSRCTSGSQAPQSAPMAPSHSLPIATALPESEVLAACELSQSSTGEDHVRSEPPSAGAKTREAIAPWDAFELPVPTVPVCAPLAVEPYTMVLPLPLPLSDALVYAESEGKSTSAPKPLRWLKVAYTPFSDVQDDNVDQNPAQAFRVTAQLLAATEVENAGCEFAPFVPIPTEELEDFLPPPMSFPTVLGFCSPSRQFEVIPDGWTALGCPFPRIDSSDPQHRLWYGFPDIILAGATIMMDL